MGIVIAIFSPGAMGSAIAARLVAHGARVLASLDGRSAATAARARAAGMEDASLARMLAADLVLSILPPGEARALAARLAPHLSASRHKPVYIDCNALSPHTKSEVAGIIAPTGCDFIDGAIVGLPPKPGDKGPRIYVCGDKRERASVLGTLGLDLRPIEGGIGAAAALKMSYAGINKGVTAIGVAMLLAASRAGAAEGLHRELRESLPDLFAKFQTGMPGMMPKAYRWVAEMREIAAFLGDDEGAAMMFEGAARVFARIAADVAGDGRECGVLEAFFREGK